MSKNQTQKYVFIGGGVLAAAAITVILVLVIGKTDQPESEDQVQQNQTNKKPNERGSVEVLSLNEIKSSNPKKTETKHASNKKPTKINILRKKDLQVIRKRVQQLLKVYLLKMTVVKGQNATPKQILRMI